MIEYAIRRFDDTGDLIQAKPGNLDQCKSWIADWIKQGGSPNLFYIAAREVNEWEKVDDEQPF